ncbi:hypothetical protein [Mycoplasma phocoenae]|uniref:S1 motif domain-containing protein n=1 Tax=Mycoplasma phocoenae TaxID=754517 RepID=A0A858U7M6_9MOLU|nr:hypothetical protein [Mycoplasma phocoenae]QJG66778.1 hypothetical protein HGG69_00315 [Mycoplasma phocoenae]
MEEKIGQLINARVIKLYRTFVLFKAKDDTICRLNLKEVSDYFIGDLEDHFKIDDWMLLKIIDVDKSKKTYIVSFKITRPKFLRNPFNFKFEKNEPGFKKLLQFSKKGLKNGRKN